MKLLKVLDRSWRWVLFFIVVLVFNFPILGTVMTSLKTTADISASPPKILFQPTLQHFEAVLTSQSVNMQLFLMNSIAIASFGTVLTIGLTLPAAYAMVRYRIGVRLLLPFITNLRTIPLIIFAIPFYLMYQVLGLLDTRTGLAIIAALINMPLAIIMFVGFVQDFPVEIEEAARVDGASAFGVFYHVILPLSRPIIASVAVLSFIYAWNEFLFGLMLTTRSATPVTVGATFFVQAFGIRWGPMAAAMVMSVLPPLILGVLSYRYFTRGLVAGAIKG
jgi:multiple sugar transport system permease protein